MLCFSIVLWLRRLGKSAPKNGRVRSAAQDEAKICTTSARESDLEVKIVKNWHDRSPGRCTERATTHPIVIIVTEL